MSVRYLDLACRDCGEVHRDGGDALRCSVKLLDRPGQQRRLGTHRAGCSCVSCDVARWWLSTMEDER